MLYKIFVIKKFIYRDILTAVFVSFVLLLLHLALYYFYKNDLILSDYIYYMIPLGLIWLFSLFLNHRINSIEYGKRSRFWKQMLQLALICFFTFLLFFIWLQITGYFFKIGFASNLMLLVTFPLLAAELFLSFINRLLLHIGYKLW